MVRVVRVVRGSALKHQIIEKSLDFTPVHRHTDIQIALFDTF